MVKHSGDEVLANTSSYPPLLRTCLCYITTQDCGQTWSGVTDLTDRLSVIKSSSTFAVGPAFRSMEPSMGPSGYSDLAYLDEGWFACLMERGESSETEQIALGVFSYDDVKQNIGK
ncbi:uncharacterized protein PAE49_024191 [Odontesthes bonariensis]